MAEENLKLNILVLGAGDRGTLFGNLAPKFDARIVAVADPDDKMRELMAEQHNIPPEMMFSSGERALTSKLPFDAVYIASPDKTHYKLAKLALDNGYNILLEKPMAVTPRQCASLVRAQEKSGKCLVIFHVLRHAPFFQTIKKIAESGELGDIVTIDLIEDIGYWHFAHSYVRGNWARECDSAPIILSKSCHDLDIISWLADSKAKTIFSNGFLRIFKPENAPKTSSDRCVDCPINDCLYDARRFYLDHKPPVHWPYRVISPEDASEEARLSAITNGPYGRCVFKCNNDVCDNQDVIIEFENGIKANFSLRAGGEKTTRKIFIQFERGELNGNLSRGKITMIRYTGRRDEALVEEIDTQELGGHGGGDPLLIKSFFDDIRSQNYKSSLTSAQKSLQSHLLAFAAEKSRKTGSLGKVIDFKRYIDDISTKIFKKRKKKSKISKNSVLVTTTRKVKNSKYRRRKKRKRKNKKK